MDTEKILEKNQMNNAILSDLDGTLIRTKSGNTFPDDMNDWELIPETIELIDSMSKSHGIPYLLIVSNQGDIGEGYVDPMEFEDKVQSIIDEIKKQTSFYKIDFLYCPDNDDTNFYRKPNPGMAYLHARNYSLILPECIMIGDREEDEGFAKSSGINEFTKFDGNEFHHSNFISMNTG